MLLVVAFAGIGAFSTLIIDYDKKRRDRAEAERRWKQLRP